MTPQYCWLVGTSYHSSLVGATIYELPGSLLQLKLSQAFINQHVTTQMLTQNHCFLGEAADGEIQVTAVTLSGLEQDSQPALIAGPTVLMIFFYMDISKNNSVTSVINCTHIKWGNTDCLGVTVDQKCKVWPNPHRIRKVFSENRCPVWSTTLQGRHE